MKLNVRLFFCLLGKVWACFEGRDKTDPFRLRIMATSNVPCRGLDLAHAGSSIFSQIAKQLNVRTFEKWTGPSNMVEREVEVHLPRFKLDVQYELNSLLKSLGMTDIFNKDKADLSGMSSAEGLYLSKVIHKSYVDVNEEGTEAAAATGANIAVKRLPIRYQFTANKPFLFLIRDNPSKMIVFCGKFASP